MNSNKWREVQLTRQTILDLVESHLYAMRGMSRREVIEIDIPSLLPTEMVTVKLKLKEVSKSVDQSGERLNAEMARKPQEEN